MTSKREREPLLLLPPSPVLAGSQGAACVTAGVPGPSPALLPLGLGHLGEAEEEAGEGLWVERGPLILLTAPLAVL